MEMIDMPYVGVRFAYHQPILRGKKRFFSVFSMLNLGDTWRQASQRIARLDARLLLELARLE
ncbi:hypothetical protein FACS189475_09380 [Betaproteobacteria bacterium]|nr:hypothetical protein FACS189475_09380 [Betaproteobacteria bacterium]